MARRLSLVVLLSLAASCAGRQRPCEAPPPDLRIHAQLPGEPPAKAPAAAPADEAAACAAGHEEHAHHHGENGAAGYRHEGHDPHHSFADAERWAKHFDDPARDAWQKPAVVIEALELEPEHVVADIGAATGYFSVRIAPKIPQGRVWAVDIEPDMVRYLNERARGEKLPNLFSVLGLPADPLLPEPVDRVLVANTYHHVSDRVGYFEALRSYLAPEARVIIVDYEKGDLPVGPPDSMKIAPSEVKGELGEAGYVVKREIHEELPYQYVLVFAAR